MLRTARSSQSLPPTFWDNSNFSHPVSEDPWKLKLLERLEKILQICGERCAIKTEAEIIDGLKQNGDDNLPYLKVKDINCQDLFALEEIDASDYSYPRSPPDELMPYYSLSGAIPVKIAKKQYSQGYLDGKAKTSKWEAARIDSDILKAAKGLLEGSYGLNITNSTRQLLNEIGIGGKRVLVIGSETPWVEELCLSLGARHVGTLEYGAIMNEHPKISTWNPSSLRTAFLSGELQLFDGVISISSLEHSGLGRYGDSLNPWGDLLTFARADCITKKDAFFALGVPFGPDKVVWNLHRIYGTIRLPLIAANWKARSPGRYSGNKGISSPPATADIINKLFVFDKA